MSFRPPLAAPAPQPHSRLRHVLEAGQAGRLASSRAATGAARVMDGKTLIWEDNDIAKVVHLWDENNNTRNGNWGLSLKFEFKRSLFLDQKSYVLEMTQNQLPTFNRMVRRYVQGQNEGDWVYVGDDGELRQWQVGLTRALLSGQVFEHNVYAVHYKKRGQESWEPLL